MIPHTTIKHKLPWHTGEGGLGGGGGGSGAKSISHLLICQDNKKLYVSIPENDHLSNNKTQLPCQTGDGGLGGGGGSSEAKNILSDIYPFTRLKLHVFSRKMIASRK